jgi:hypothetical protein
VTIDLAQLIPWLQTAGPVGYGVLAALAAYKLYLYVRGKLSPPTPGPGVPPLAGPSQTTPPPFPILNLLRRGLATLGHAVPGVVEDIPPAVLQQLHAEVGQLLDHHAAKHAAALAALKIARPGPASGPTPPPAAAAAP